MAIDGGLHRDVGAYDIFNPIEREVRKVSSIRPFSRSRELRVDLVPHFSLSSEPSGLSTAGTNSQALVSVDRL